MSETRINSGYSLYVYAGGVTSNVAVGSGDLQELPSSGVADGLNVSSNESSLKKTVLKGTNASESLTDTLDTKTSSNEADMNGAQSLLFRCDATESVAVRGNSVSTASNIVFGGETAQTAAWIEASAPDDAQNIAKGNETWEKMSLLAS